MRPPLHLLLLATLASSAHPRTCTLDNSFSSTLFYCPGPSWDPWEVKVNYKQDRKTVEITCDESTLTASELGEYLEYLSNLPNRTVDLTSLTKASFKTCPAGFYATLLKRPPSLKKLAVRGTTSQLTAVHLAGLPSLKTVFLNSSLVTIDASLFSELTNLEKVYFSNMTNVTKDAFHNNKKLNVIYLFSTNIETLDNDTFKDLTNLETLSLEDNNLINLPHGIFRDLANLNTLKLNQNNLVSLPNNLLHPLSNLKMLYLNKNPIASLSSDFLSHNSNLTMVKLREIEITEIPEELFRKTKKLKHIHLDQIGLSSIPETLFQGLHELESLNLDDNKLNNSALVASKLKDLRSLDRLQLNNNLFTSPIVPTLKHVQKSLTKVELKNNSLTQFETSWIRNFPELKGLDLGSNKLNGYLHLDQSDLAFDKLDKLKLGKNMIKGLVIEKANVTCNNYVTLELADNKLSCDCYAADLKEIVNNDTNEFCLKTKKDKEKLTCYNNNHNHTIDNVPDDLLTCSVSCGQFMPESFLDRFNPSCKYSSANKTAYIDCSNNISTSTKLSNKTKLSNEIEIKLIMNDQKIKELTGIFPKEAKYKIISLDVSGNLISKVDKSDLPPSLTSLYLRNNSIKELTDKMIEYLSKFPDQSISLGHNPLLCDCESLALLNFLHANDDKLSDSENISFSCHPVKLKLNGKHIENSDICISHETAMFTSSTLVLVLVLISLVFTIRNKDVLKLHFFSHRWVTRWFPEDWLLPYDVFISYSHDDKEFAEGTLWHQLEKVIQPPYRCFIHMRDFNVGEMISDQIVAAVEQSRRTVIVLSAKYTTAMWTRLEFRAAHERANRNRRQRLIIVLPPDTELPQRSDLDEELRPYFDTALRADDSNFWLKLRLALPMRGSSQADGRERGAELELVPGAREVMLETGHCPVCPALPGGQAGEEVPVLVAG